MTEAMNYEIVDAPKPPEPTIYDVLPCTNPILHKPTERFDFKNPPMNPAELANNLIATMSKYNGLGLAANQVGIPYSVFVLHSQAPLALFNPKLIDTSIEENSLEEGCLSRPGFFVKIKRPAIIKVRYTKYTGETVTEKFIGMTARCILHELDHLNGIDYTTRAHKLLLDRALRQKKIRDRQVKRAVGSLHNLSRALPRKLGDEIAET